MAGSVVDLVFEPDQAGLALDEGADRRVLVLADDEVTFPVTRLAAVGGDRMAADGSTTSAGRTSDDAGQAAGERGDESGPCATRLGVAT